MICRTLLQRASFLAASLVLAACSSTTSTSPSPPAPIHASDFNQSCQVAGDCALVDEGDVCGCGSCGNAGINKADLSNFEAEVSRRKQSCTNPMQACPALSCVFSAPTCAAGVCGACHQLGCNDVDGGADGAHEASGD